MKLRLEASAWLLAGASLLATPAPPSPPPADSLAAVQELLDAEQPEAAADLLDRWLNAHPDDAEALLLRSTARFLLGEMESGRADLDRALELDPQLRQGWLNRAALKLADNDLDGALAAFRKAEELAPAALDNALNIGAVLLLKGQLDEASRRFSSYLEGRPGSADARYLVASNYALAGYVGLCLEHLRGAIGMDERMRLRARHDPNFETLAGSRQFQDLLLTDSYSPPPGAHRAVRRFEVTYDGGSGPLLRAVLDALQLSGRPYDPRIEVTPDWALVWSDVRIKIQERPDGGEVLLTAPAARFTPGEWSRRSDELFRQIAVQLFSRRQPAAAADPGSLRPAGESTRS